MRDGLSSQIVASLGNRVAGIVGHLGCFGLARFLIRGGLIPRSDQPVAIAAHRFPSSLQLPNRFAQERITADIFGS